MKKNLLTLVFEKVGHKASQSGLQWHNNKYVSIRLHRARVNMSWLTAWPPRSYERLLDLCGHVWKVYSYVTSIGDLRKYIFGCLGSAARTPIGCVQALRPAHCSSVAFSTSPRCWLLGSGSSFSTPSQGRRRDTRSGCCSLPLLPSPSSNQTYGNGPPSFLHRCVHYSLKIPPKKRRRFSNAYLPLSHVSRAPRNGRWYEGRVCASCLGLGRRT